MARREARQYKALYFDLYVQALKQFYPNKNHLILETEDFGLDLEPPVL